LLSACSSYSAVDEIVTNRHKSRADADYYSLERQAKANELLLTKEYLELKRYESITANTKLYFGANIPTLFMGDQQPSSGSLPVVTEKASN
jgi:hypothetical protein